MAKQLVLDLIAQKDAQNQQAANARPGMGGMGSNNGPSGGGGGNYNNFGANGGGESLEVFVPKIAVGVVIGKGGDMIRKIQQECGCKLQFIQGKHDEPGDRRCLIQGSRQQVDDAKRMIDGLIENVMVTYYRRREFLDNFEHVFYSNEIVMVMAVLVVEILRVVMIMEIQIMAMVMALIMLNNQHVKKLVLWYQRLSAV